MKSFDFLMLTAMVTTVAEDTATDLPLPTAVAEDCKCKFSWVSPDTPGCGTLQSGCAMDAEGKACDYNSTDLADLGKPWCVIDNPGCLTAKRGEQKWSYCTNVTAVAEQKESCICKNSWTTEDCSGVQSGCATDADGHACDTTDPANPISPWCTVSNPGCAGDENDGFEWSYCTPEETDVAAPGLACECKHSWSSPRDPGCEGEQFGCAANKDAQCDNSEPWCMISDPGCETAADDGTGWSWCSEETKIADPLPVCECMDSWASQTVFGCETEQLGCAANKYAQCDKYEPWCKVKDPKCATALPGGWSWCSAASATAETPEVAIASATVILTLLTALENNTATKEILTNYCAVVLQVLPLGSRVNCKIEMDSSRSDMVPYTLTSWTNDAGLIVSDTFATSIATFTDTATAFGLATVTAEVSSYARTGSPPAIVPFAVTGEKIAPPPMVRPYSKTESGDSSMAMSPPGPSSMAALLGLLAFFVSVRSV